jgi:hypothetical protein
MQTGRRRGKHLLCLVFSLGWHHDIDLNCKISGKLHRQFRVRRTGVLADSFLGGREAPLRTGADEMTPVACQRVTCRPNQHDTVRNHLLNLNSVMFLKS